jgi:hypothetical protein
MKYNQFLLEDLPELNLYQSTTPLPVMYAQRCGVASTNERGELCTDNAGKDYVKVDVYQTSKFMINGGHQKPISKIFIYEKD